MSQRRFFCNRQTNDVHQASRKELTTRGGVDVRFRMTSQSGSYSFGWFVCDKNLVRHADLQNINESDCPRRNPTTPRMERPFSYLPFPPSFFGLLFDLFFIPRSSIFGAHDLLLSKGRGPSGLPELLVHLAESNLTSDGNVDVVGDSRSGGRRCRRRLAWRRRALLFPFLFPVSAPHGQDALHWCHGSPDWLSCSRNGISQERRRSRRHHRPAFGTSNFVRGRTQGTKLQRCCVVKCEGHEQNSNGKQSLLATVQLVVRERSLHLCPFVRPTNL